MLPIKKLPEPQGLLDYKAGEKPTYLGFTNFRKELNEQGERIYPDPTPFFQLRSQLLREQKFLCAYCGQEVLLVENVNGKAQMKTEHFNPQNNTPENDLNYENLLGCCLGRDNLPGENHCDSMKASGILAYLQNPATIDFRDAEIIYDVGPNRKEVTIFSKNDSKNIELTGKKKGCLNLNHDALKEGRFSVLKNVLQRRLGEDQSQWDKGQVNEIVSEYSDPNSTHHPKFTDFVLWYLEDWRKNNG